MHPDRANHSASRLQAGGRRSPIKSQARSTDLSVPSSVPASKAVYVPYLPAVVAIDVNSVHLCQTSLTSRKRQLPAIAINQNERNPKKFNRKPILQNEPKRTGFRNKPMQGSTLQTVDEQLGYRKPSGTLAPTAPARLTRTSILRNEPKRCKNRYNLLVQNKLQALCPALSDSDFLISPFIYPSMSHRLILGDMIKLPKMLHESHLHYSATGLRYPALLHYSYYPFDRLIACMRIHLGCSRTRRSFAERRFFCAPSQLDTVQSVFTTRWGRSLPYGVFASNVSKANIARLFGVVKQKSAFLVYGKRCLWFIGILRFTGFVEPDCQVRRGSG